MASVMWAMMWVGLVTLLLVTTPALPATHWLVTETGKVEAQPDSIFHMRQPYDLVSFIHQEQRFTDMNNLHDKLSKFRSVLSLSCLGYYSVITEASWMITRAWMFLMWRVCCQERWEAV